MSRRVILVAIVCALAALPGCGSGDDGEADKTTTTTTTAAANLPKLSAAESRRAAAAMLGSWSTLINKTLTKIAERQAAANKGLREAYYKADAQLLARLTQIAEFPAQARSAGARWTPQSLAHAMAADGDAWKDWADGVADIRAAAERGTFPENLIRAALLTHVAAYKAVKRTPPENFRHAQSLLEAGA